MLAKRYYLLVDLILLCPALQLEQYDFALWVCGRLVYQAQLFYAGHKKVKANRKSLEDLVSEAQDVCMLSMWMVVDKFKIMGKQNLNLFLSAGFQSTLDFTEA